MSDHQFARSHREHMRRSLYADQDAKQAKAIAAHGAITQEWRERMAAQMMPRQTSPQPLAPRLPFCQFQQNGGRNPKHIGFVAAARARLTAIKSDAAVKQAEQFAGGVR